MRPSVLLAVYARCVFCRVASTDHITAEQLANFYDMMTRSDDSLTLDHVFDVDCYQNDNQVCIEECLYHCALASNFSYEECRRNLALGCRARSGGFFAWPVASQLASTDPFNTADKNSKTFSFNFSADLTEVLGNSENVAIEDVFMAFVDPDHMTPNFDGVEEEFDENMVNDSECGIGRGLGISWEYDSSGSAGGKELRGLNAGAFRPIRGWKVFREYLNEHDAEIVKGWYLYRLSDNALAGNYLFPILDESMKTVLTLGDISNCLPANLNIAYNTLFMVVWTRQIEGLGSNGNNWGFPMPRVHQTCVLLDACATCEKETDCQWCMTPSGQSCEAASECTGGVFMPLDC